MDKNENIFQDLDEETLEKLNIKSRESQQKEINDDSTVTPLSEEEYNEANEIVKEQTDIMKKDPSELTPEEIEEIRRQQELKDQKDMEEIQKEELVLPNEKKSELIHKEKSALNIIEEGLKNKEDDVQHIKSDTENIFTGNEKEKTEVKSTDKTDVTELPEEEVKIDEESDSFIPFAKDEDGTFLDEDDEYMYTDYKDQQVRQAVSNVLEGLEFNLDDVQIVDKPEVHRMNDMKNIFDKEAKPVFNVVCAQSGYSAGMSSLNMVDINAITSSTETAYQSRNRLFKTIYNKIETMSIPKPSYEDWLRITSLGDLDTLLFGIYCQTYPDNNDFDIKCGECGMDTPLKMDNQNLIEVKRLDVYKGKLDEILNNVKDMEKLVENSLVNKGKKVLLEDSKIIMEIFNPSLQSNLNILKSISGNNKLIMNYTKIINMMTQIKNVLMPDVGASTRLGQPIYYPIKDMNGIMDLILNLSAKDGAKLEKEIVDINEKYAVEYSIRNAKCKNCNNPIEPIPIDMETILFMRIQREQGVEI